EVVFPGGDAFVAGTVLAVLAVIGRQKVEEFRVGGLADVVAAKDVALGELALGVGQAAGVGVVDPARGGLGGERPAAVRRGELEVGGLVGVAAEDRAGGGDGD